ncbi:BTAD domain-containing putative transcriptional regulator [Streptomyces rishiriensis]|uniref:BTAD domain-containing putative transcriptional regulator n=1 Tax=Streptomyces rishiriensis TaxID=68264 RepID=UPI000D5965C0|nr:BTAD domain-containing putative transcriptional regulator [Streptomyces rishiriensis]
MEATGIRVAVLGPLVVRDLQGDPVALPGARLSSLVIRLALAGGRPVATERLIEDLWGSAPPANPLNAVQALVSRLRRLAPHLPVSSSLAGYALDVAPEAVDLWRFEKLTARGRGQLPDRPDLAAATLRQALELWRGEEFTEAAGALFTQAPAVHARELRRSALAGRIDADLALGRAAEALPELERLVHADPADEWWAARLMLALRSVGRQADALEAYGQTRGALAELGIDPSPELAGVHLAVLRGTPAPGAARSAAPPGASPAPQPPPRTGVPPRLTGFLGREGELARLAELFTSQRLVTVAGPGGIGKTRLATEAAQLLADRFEDGVWWVDLAALRDPARVAEAVLATLEPGGPAVLGGQVPLGRGTHERLADLVGGRRMLVVFDNCEHLVEAVARHIDVLLASCPQVRVLATSREPLAVAGERVLPLGPLAPPPVGAALPEVTASPAVRLLAERTREVRPSFVVDEANAGDVARICRRLDGLPLALELASARLRALSPAQIADRLEEHFRLLTGNRRGGPDRHRTLDAVVGWSWNLLSPEERVLARRLAVFSGGATLDAAERVCACATAALPADATATGGSAADVSAAGGLSAGASAGRRLPADASAVAGLPPAAPAAEGLPPENVVDLVTALVDKSLLLVDESDGRVRYRMLGTIREYLVEQLGAAEGEMTRRAHAAYFLELAEAAEPQLLGADQVTWLARLAAEQDNVQAALQWAVETGEGGLAVRLVAALGWYWFLRGQQVEAADWAARALAAPGDAPPDARALVLIMSALVPATSAQGVAEAMTRIRQWMDLTERTRPEGARKRPELAAFQAMLSMLDQDLAGALAAMERLTHEADPWTRACGHLNCGHIHGGAGDVPRARQHYRSALHEARSIGERWGQIQALSALAEIAATLEGAEEAAQLLEDALQLAVELGAVEDQITIRARLAGERARAGDLAGGRGELELGLRTARRAGITRCLPQVCCGLADVARWEGDLPGASAVLGRSMASLSAVSRPDVGQLALTLCGQGHVDVAGRRLASARERYQEAATYALLLGDPKVIAAVARLGADIAQERGDAERAMTLLGVGDALTGEAGRTHPDARRVRTRCEALAGGPALDSAYRGGAAAVATGDRDALTAVLAPAGRDEGPPPGP